MMQAMLRVLSLALLLAPSAALAAFGDPGEAITGGGNYFVECGAGNNSADGLSHANRWNSIGKVNSTVSAASSNVWLLDGSVCDNQRLYVDWSGTSSDRSFVGCYEMVSGNPVVCRTGQHTKPELNGVLTQACIAAKTCNMNDSSVSTVFQALIDVDADYVTVQDIRATEAVGRGFSTNGKDSPGNDANGIHLLRVESSYTGMNPVVLENNIKNAIIRDSVFHDYNLCEQGKVYTVPNSSCKQGSTAPWPPGVAIFRSPNSHSLIENNTVYRGDGEGINPALSTHIIVRGNVVSDTRSATIYFGAANHIVVENNIVIGSPNNGQQFQDRGSQAGILLNFEKNATVSSAVANRSGSDNVIRNNLIYGHGTCIGANSVSIEAAEGGYEIGGTFYGNTCIGYQTFGINVNHASGAQSAIGRFEFHDNIFFAPSAVDANPQFGAVAPCRAKGSGPIIINNNLWDQDPTDQCPTATSANGNVIGVPGFAATEADGVNAYWADYPSIADVTLQTGSPAIGIGGSASTSRNLLTAADYPAKAEFIDRDVSDADWEKALRYDFNGDYRHRRTAGALEFNPTQGSALVGGGGSAPTNEPPVARNDAFTVLENSGVTSLAVLADNGNGPDFDPDDDTISITGLGSAGGLATVSVNGTSIDFQPAASVTGPVPFTYTVGDGNGAFDSATVTVTVTGVATAPTLVDDAETVNENTVGNILSPLVNDSANTGTLEITAATAISGTVETNWNGTQLIYSPVPDSSASDTITYTGCNGTECGTAEVAVTVTAAAADSPLLRTILPTNIAAFEANSIDVTAGGGGMLRVDCWESSAVDDLGNMTVSDGVTGVQMAAGAALQHAGGATLMKSYTLTGFDLGQLDGNANIEGDGDQGPFCPRTVWQGLGALSDSSTSQITGGTTLTTNPVNVPAGGLVIITVTSSSDRSFVCPNGFTEVFDRIGQSDSAAQCYKREPSALTGQQYVLSSNGAWSRGISQVQVYEAAAVVTETACTIGAVSLGGGSTVDTASAGAPCTLPSEPVTDRSFLVDGAIDIYYPAHMGFCDETTYSFTYENLPTGLTGESNGRLHGSIGTAGTYADISATCETAQGANRVTHSFTVTPPLGAQQNPGNYIALTGGNENLAQTSLTNQVDQPGVTGLIKRWTWSEVETAEGVYDFSEIVADAARVEALGLKLIALIEFKSFGDDVNPAPAYLSAFTEVNNNSTASTENPAVPGRTVLMWKPEVVTAWNNMVSALGTALASSGGFEGLAFQESALGITDANLATNGYTPLLYRDALISMLTANSAALPSANVFWLFNFIAATGFPETSDGMGRDVVNAVKLLGNVVLGGPDILQNSASLQSLTYPVLRQYKDQIPIFGWAQFDSFEESIADDGNAPFFTMQQQRDYASANLGADYMFWNNKTWAGTAGSYNIDDALPVMAANPVVSHAGYAIDFTYQVVENRSKYIALSAWNDRIEAETNTEANPDHLRYQPYRYNALGVFMHWRVTDLPDNGDLWDRGCNSGAGCLVTTTSQTISTGDNLVYVPDADYIGPDEFAYVANDPERGDSEPATVELSVVAANAYVWEQFIPEPAFGMTEERPADPAGWASGPVEGYFYIDKDDPNAVACSGQNLTTGGWPGAPCSNIPFRPIITDLMLIKGASTCYDLQNAGAHDLTLNGTAQDPAWMYGDESTGNKPCLQRNSANTGDSRVEVAGSYQIIAGLEFREARLLRKSGNPTDSHIAYRNVEISGAQISGQTALEVLEVADTDTNFLVFDAHIHGNGVDVNPAYSDENDTHAILISDAQKVHIAGLVTHDNGGDGIQAGDNNNATEVYIQEWRCHTEGEQCMDWKNMGASDGDPSDLVYVVADADVWDGRAGFPTGGSPTSGHGLYQNDDNTHWIGRGLIKNSRSWDNTVAQIVATQVGTTSTINVIGNMALHGRNDEFELICFVGDGDSSCAGSQAAGLGTFKNSNQRFYFNTTFNTHVGVQANSAGIGPTPIKYVAGNLFDNAKYWHVKTGSGIDSGTYFDWNGYGGAMAYQGPSNGHPFTILDLAGFQGTAQTADPDRGSQAVVLEAGADFVAPYRGDVTPQAAGALNAVPIAEIESDNAYAGLRNFLTEWGLTSITQLADRNGKGYCDGAACNLGAIQGPGDPDPVVVAQNLGTDLELDPNHPLFDAVGAFIVVNKAASAPEIKDLKSGNLATPGDAVTYVADATHGYVWNHGGGSETSVDNDDLTGVSFTTSAQHVTSVKSDTAAATVMLLGRSTGTGDDHLSTYARLSNNDFGVEMYPGAQNPATSRLAVADWTVWNQVGASRDAAAGQQVLVNGVQGDLQNGVVGNPNPLAHPLLLGGSSDFEIAYHIIFNRELSTAEAANFADPSYGWSMTRTRVVLAQNPGTTIRINEAHPQAKDIAAFITVQNAATTPTLVDLKSGNTLTLGDSVTFGADATHGYIWDQNEGSVSSMAVADFDSTAFPNGAHHMASVKSDIADTAGFAAIGLSDDIGTEHLAAFWRSGGDVLAVEMRPGSNNPDSSLTSNLGAAWLTWQQVGVSRDPTAGQAAWLDGVLYDRKTDFLGAPNPITHPLELGGNNADWKYGYYIIWNSERTAQQALDLFSTPQGAWQLVEVAP